MRIIKYIVAFVIVGFVFRQMPLHARPIPGWSYDDLAKASDVVAVIEPLKNENNDEKLKIEGSKGSDFQGLSTTVKVHYCFKGSLSLDELVVKHFKYGPSIGPPDGAEFISFLVGPLKYKKTDLKDDKEVGGITYYQATPSWLAFLKKAPDGSYIPVTGQYDASLSFKELHDPSFFTGE